MMSTLIPKLTTFHCILPNKKRNQNKDTLCEPNCTKSACKLALSPSAEGSLDATSFGYGPKLEVPQMVWEFVSH